MTLVCTDPCLFINSLDFLQYEHFTFHIKDEV